MPRGNGSIAGRITWRDTKIGIPRVIVYTQPGYYGAVTDNAGHFEIKGIPQGRYRVTAFADGYTSVRPQTADVRGGRAAKFNGRMERVSLVPHHFGEPGKPARRAKPGSWAPTSQSMDKVSYWLDDSVRFRTLPALRVELRRGQGFGLFNYGGYNSAYPNEVQVADVYVRAQRAKIEPGGGPWLELDLTNGRGEILSAARAFNPDFKADGKWYRITAAVLGPARTSRVRLTFGVEKAFGTFWFSTPFAGEADFPLPADANYKTTGYVAPLYEQNKAFFAQTVVDIKQRNPSLKAATVAGQVLDFRGRPLPKATVASDSPLFLTLTDERGRYRLTVPAGRRMRVRAFALGETPALSEPIQLATDQTRRIDLQTAPPPAPTELVNGDFNTYHPKEPGLMTGWQGFGATDGIYQSGHERIIFRATSHEGGGLYFAQSGSNTKNGGAYQIIQATPGRKYRLTGWVYTLTQGEAKKPLDNNCRLGVDPTGGRDPDSADVVWTDPTESQKKWMQISVEATAQTSRITVFLRHEMRRANTWNLTLFDDLRLEKAGD